MATWPDDDLRREDSELEPPLVDEVLLDADVPEDVVPEDVRAEEYRPPAHEYDPDRPAAEGDVADQSTELGPDVLDDEP